MDYGRDGQSSRGTVGILEIRNSKKLHYPHIEGQREKMVSLESMAQGHPQLPVQCELGPGRPVLEMLSKPDREWEKDFFLLPAFQSLTSASG